MTDLPPGWEWATLGELVAADGHFSDGDWVESKDQDPDGEVRLVQLADIGDCHFRDRSDRSLTTEKAHELRCHFLRAGDVLIARMPEPLGRACIYPGDCRPAVTVVDVCILRPGNNSVDPRWLMWCINSPSSRAQIEAMKTGTTRKRVSRSNLSKVRLPVAPLAEQRRIVTALEDHLSRLDSGVAGVQATARRLQRLRDQVIAAGCTGSLFGMESAAASSPPHVGLHEGSLPRIPQQWRWVRLHEVADVVGGITKDSKKQADPALEEVPYLRVANVQRGHIDLSKVTTIRASKEKIEQLALRSGDVLLNEGGDRDKLARGWVWEGQLSLCIHQNHVFRARVRDGVLDPKILAWHANSFGRVWAEANGKQSVNLASISLSKIRLLPVPIPPKAEQSRIVEMIEERLDAVARLMISVSKAEDRAKQLRRSLLAEAFAGRLVPQEPNDEPASVLLERMRLERAAQTRPKSTRRSRQDHPTKENLL